MKNFFKSLFSSAQAKPHLPAFKMVEIPFDEIASHATSVEKVLSNSPTGFVIKNFLSPTEVASIISGHQGLKDEEIIRINSGFDCYPMSFAQFEQNNLAGNISREDYYSRANQFKNGFPTRFGVDFESKLLGAVQNIFPDLKSQIAIDKDEYGSMVPFSFRDLKPGPGTLKAHCGHYFYNEFPTLKERMDHFSDSRHQFSFFVLLRAADKGGELTLFDLFWEDAKKRPNDETVVTEKGKSLNLNDHQEVYQEKVKPVSGDLIIFNGGDVWHRVEFIQGEQNRLTLGGFISFSEDLKNCYLWS